LNPGLTQSRQGAKKYLANGRLSGWSVMLNQGALHLAGGQNDGGIMMG